MSEPDAPARVRIPEPDATRPAKPARRSRKRGPNWLGHGPDHDGTSLVEFDRDGKIVWRYGRPHASFVEVILLDTPREKAEQSSRRE